MADIYGPRSVFCVGYLVLGAFGIVCGFSVQPIMLLVCRAVQGIGALHDSADTIAHRNANVHEHLLLLLFLRV